MMKDIKKETRQSSLVNEMIRNSGFVPYKISALESFKNSKAYNILKKINPKLHNLKRFIKSIMTKPRLWMSFIEWKNIKRDLPIWFCEVLIEGVVANWWTHKIFGLEFGLGMIIAHGALIKQGLNLIWRIKKDGQPSTIPTKN